jgi:ABC-type transport system involved in multi-copper enzyme maturation permease subunit
MTRVVRAELFKFRTTPGPWVVTGVSIALTALIVLTAFGLAGSLVGKTFAAPRNVEDLRLLLGAGYQGAILVAPVLGVLCVTSEYRHKVLTTSLLITPRREQLLVAKGVACVVWGVLMCVASYVVVVAMGVTWLALAGGSPAALWGQAGAVVPTLFLAFALLTLFGLGIGTLIKNQVGAVLVILGFTVILEPLIVLLLKHIFQVDLNWLPSEATRALVGGLITGNGNNGNGNAVNLLSWWEGGLALLAWGLVPAVIGYFTSFRRDVT